MKSTELRIGNWAYFDNKACMVDAIDKDILTDEHDGMPYKLEDVVPIPLTEDWMRKFGFITLDSEIDYKEWGIDDNKNGMEFSLVSDGFDKPIPIYFEYDLGQGDVKKEIKYVHQLQNLYFALTGEELTIKP